jgi:hypothetical protein
MRGHVFIVHGDLRRLACDAWLLPTDSRLNVEENWRGFPDASSPALPPAAPTEAWRARTERVLKAPDAGPRAPQPWLVNVGSRSPTPVSWFVDGARAFLDAVAADLRGTKPKNGRAAHLVALPVVGTGRGGAKHMAGDVVRELLPALEAKTIEHAIDIALVAIDEPTYASAQAERRARAAVNAPWSEVDARLRASAEALAERASNGKLVLFLGAGVSVGAGLPSWGELLERMAVPAHLSSEERAQLARFDAMDQASILKARIEAASEHADFRAEIVRLARGAHASLTHEL